MDLGDYLHRIRYDGPLSLDYETLRQLHRAHLFAIPYENLDIHLDRTLTLDLDHIYTKIVENQRGGWCYEMNGLFAWALQELGFDVTMLGSTVNSPSQGPEGDFDHLILLVKLERPWLVDVGFGNGLLEPIPLAEGEYHQGFLSFRLSCQDDSWYLHNHEYGTDGYGFTLQPRHYQAFATRCHELQTLPDSGFVRSTVCYRFMSGGYSSLRGAIFKRIVETGVEEEEITSLERYVEVLDSAFGLEIASVNQLWSRVWARHIEWKASMPLI